MKKFKYLGDDTVVLLIPDNPLVVNKGDVVDTPDDFLNADFEEVVATQDTTTTTSKK